MLERHPPRREPRLLLIDATKAPVRYVVLDPWEIRGLGTLATHAPSQALLRLVLQGHPSHLAVLHPEDSESLRGLSSALAVVVRRALPVVHITLVDVARLLARIGAVDIREEFPELRHLARGRREAMLLETVLRAFAVLLHQPLPQRHYAARFSAEPSSPVARRRLRSPRRAPLP